MVTCEEHGDCVVVYNARNCPVCTERDELARQIDTLEAEVLEWKRDVEDLKDRLAGVLP
jgi:hypothetical protein